MCVCVIEREMIASDERNKGQREKQLDKEGYYNGSSETKERLEYNNGEENVYA